MSQSAEQKLAKALVNSFPVFAKHCLKLRSDSGEIFPFVLNRAQIILHDKLEDMKRRKGRVRAIIVKSRQMGSSTYMEGRFFHKIWSSPENKSLNAFILAHNDKSTNSIFNMAKRFHDYLPSDLKPPLLKSNEKEMVFGHNGSFYSVSTAGSKDIGRGTTIQLLHASEVSYWGDAESHMSSLGQAVPKLADTEIVLESTAQGIGNVFHKMYKAVMNGDSDYEVIFMPWFWSEKYEIQKDTKEFYDMQKWNPPEKWLAYAKTCKMPNGFGISWEQLYWAYLKNAEIAAPLGEPFDEPCYMFRQEFPSNLPEAFQTSGSKSFIPALSVAKARKPVEPIVGRGKLILGVDPSRSGDKVGIIDRRGRRMGENVCMLLDPQGSLSYVAGQVAQIIQRINPDHVCIDVGGNGTGVHDILRDDYGFTNLIPVNFAHKAVRRGPTGDPLYLNKRAEMWDKMRQWLTSDEDVQIPDRDDLHEDLVAPIWGANGCRTTSSNVLQIEEKDKIKQRLGHSPDLGDAACLTHAIDFVDNSAISYPIQPRQTKRKSTGY